MALDRIHKEKLEAAIDKWNEKVDMKVLTEMKEILNKTFGEEFNQIVKPDTDNYLDCSLGALNETYITRCVQSDIERGLSLLDTSLYMRVREYLGYLIIVHMPEVTIKNSRGQSHVIRDLYMRIPVRPDGRFFNDLQGIRTTFTSKEGHNNYVHSHLPSMLIKDPIFQYFCTGSGEINQVTTLLKRAYNKIDFQLFCLHLKVFAAWESLEGTPYANIANVLIRSTEIVNTTIAQTHLDHIITFLIKKLGSDVKAEELVKLLKLELNENGIYVEPTEELEQQLATLITTSSTLIIPGARNEVLLAYKNTSGKYFSHNGTGSSPYVVTPKTVLKFKNKEIKLKIQDHEAQEQLKVYPLPEITKGICSKLSKLFTEELYNNTEESATVSTPEDKSKVAGTNLVSL